MSMMIYEVIDKKWSFVVQSRKTLDCPYIGNTTHDSISVYHVQHWTSAFWTNFSIVLSCFSCFSCFFHVSDTFWHLPSSEFQKFYCVFCVVHTTRGNIHASSLMLLPLQTAALCFMSIVSSYQNLQKITKLSEVHVGFLQQCEVTDWRLVYFMDMGPLIALNESYMDPLPSEEPG